MLSTNTFLWLIKSTASTTLKNNQPAKPLRSNHKGNDHGFERHLYFGYSKSPITDRAAISILQHNKFNV